MTLMQQTRYATRDAWLMAGMEQIRDAILAPIGLDTNAVTGTRIDVDNVIVGCGWPTSRATSANNRRLAQTFHPSMSKGGKTEIFISPFIDDPSVALRVLAEELALVALGVKGAGGGKNKAFKRLLEQQVRVDSPEFEANIASIALDLGEYPHHSIDYTTLPKQGVRNILYSCPNDECPKFLTEGKRNSTRHSEDMDLTGGCLCALCHHRMVDLTKQQPEQSEGESSDDQPEQSEGEGDGQGDNQDKPEGGGDPSESGNGEGEGEGEGEGDGEGEGTGDADSGGSEDGDSGSQSSSGADGSSDGSGSGGTDAGSGESGNADDNDGPAQNLNVTTGGINPARAKLAQLLELQKAHPVDLNCTRGANGGMCENCEHTARELGML